MEHSVYNDPAAGCFDCGTTDKIHADDCKAEQTPDIEHTDDELCLMAASYWEDQMDPSLPLSAYPLRCLECAFCRGTLSKAGPDTPWTDPFGGTECEAAPNPSDGPMPGHRPGSVVVAKPAEVPVRLVTPAAPHVVWIPPFGGGAA